MKKSKVFLSVLTPVAAVAATSGIVAGTLSLTSCSSSRFNPTISRYNVNLKNGAAPSQYSLSARAMNRPTILQNASTNNVQGVEDEIDANFNQNPFIQMQDKFGGNINKLIEEDVNDVILEFLSCMEQESSLRKRELEIELLEKEDLRWSNPIQVKNAKFDENFLETKKISVTADVWVEYEYKVGKKEYEGEKLIRGINFDLYAEFAGRDEILTLTQKVANKKHEVQVNGKEMDYKDIMELLVGEVNDDPFDFDFDDLFERKDSSIDDIGLLKYMSKYNDLTSPNAKMFGYSFDVLEFWNSLMKQWNSQMTNAPKMVMPRSIERASDYYFWAPSTAVCNIFVPNLSNGTDLSASIKNITTDYKSYSSLSTELSKLVANSSNNYEALRTWLNKYNISFPSTINFVNARLEREIDYSAGKGIIKKLELKIFDQFNNKYEIEFYSNWWRIN